MDLADHQSSVLSVGSDVSDQTASSPTDSTGSIGSKPSPNTQVKPASSTKQSTLLSQILSQKMFQSTAAGAKRSSTTTGFKRSSTTTGSKRSSTIHAKHASSTLDSEEDKEVMAKLMVFLETKNH